jgi:hypothetical protein
MQGFPVGCPVAGIYSPAKTIAKTYAKTIKNPNTVPTERIDRVMPLTMVTSSGTDFINRAKRESLRSRSKRNTSRPPRGLDSLGSIIKFISHVSAIIMTTRILSKTNQRS